MEKGTRTFSLAVNAPLFWVCHAGNSVDIILRAQRSYCSLAGESPAVVTARGPRS